MVGADYTWFSPDTLELGLHRTWRWVFFHAPSGLVVSWNANEDIVAKTKEAMEVPGLVGPRNEEKPVVEEGSKSTKRKRRLTDVAKDIYKRARASCLAHIEKRGLARGKVESDDEIIDVIGGDPVVHRSDLLSFLQTNGLDAHHPRRNFFHLPARVSTNHRLWGGWQYLPAFVCTKSSKSSSAISVAGSPQRHTPSENSAQNINNKMV